MTLEVGDVDRIRRIGVPAQTLARRVCHHPMLVWVRTGQADVRANGNRVRVHAGAAALVARGQSLGIEVSRGSVVIPVELRTAGESPVAAAPLQVLNVPEAMTDRLIYEFAMNLGYLQLAAGHHGFSDALLGAVERAVPPGESVRRRDGQPELPEPRSSPDRLTLPLPHSPQARAVAEAVMADLAGCPPLHELARARGISERTLHRRFLDETGMSPSAWRAEARLQTASEFLRLGKEVGWTAHRVGYSGPGALSKAFRLRFGMPPSAFRPERSGREQPVVTREKVVNRAENCLSSVGVPAIPLGHTGVRINGAHVVLWMFRGTATVRIAGKTLGLKRGDVAVLPAGSPVEVAVDAGALALPLGYIPAGIVGQPPRVAFSVPTDAEWEEILLHRVVSSYTQLKPKGGWAVSVLDIVGGITRWEGAPRGAKRRVQSDVLAGRQRDPDTSLSAEWLVDIADARWATASLAEVARLTGVSASATSEWFQQATGVRYSEWAMIRRMTLAKAKIAKGMPLRRIAIDLGYSQTSAFSRAFSSFHGIGPAAYRGSVVRVE
ncbi:helix-turn-helix transcriptional regulator [Corynebacterium freneyi]|uniref:AraC-like DNA-binding protein n=1 Tax=Corynebacterium freneyi TaxID=134034 RepID=A0ABS4U5P5_9CORY|nr:helix-turn-helix transcriptional regulator [Corynebacterium freneyi]MBP2331981.1 AraC-like DNA-binding protein [Corynebacterium freneyi]QXA53769.1 helix-turn-helix domain-containing protein [Corynebacterium freneyi]